MFYPENDVSESSYESDNDTNNNDNENIAKVTYGAHEYHIDTFGVTDFISRSLLNGYIWEPNIASYIHNTLTPDWVFIDIGCNIGTHTFLAQQSGAHTMLRLRM